MSNISLARDDDDEEDDDDPFEASDPFDRSDLPDDRTDGGRDVVDGGDWVDLKDLILGGLEEDGGLDDVMKISEIFLYSQIPMS
ncbi:hypothetical protein OAV62_01210 [bacterium]|nr:hypothetical protein [bacterium]